MSEQLSMDFDAAMEAPAPAPEATVPAREKAVAPPPAPPAAAMPSQRNDGLLHRLVDSNFLQYASYVIRDRAIPDLDDGLKPVQRRIL